MHPILIDFGWRTLPLLGETHLYIGTYGVLFAASALIGWFVWVKVARRDGLDSTTLTDIGFYALFAGIFGSKLGLILLDPGYYLTNPGALLGTLRAAGVLLVGVIAAVVTIALLCRRHGMSFWSVVDSMAPSLALGQAIGRIGCFMAGCCYGKAAPGLPWGVCFTDPAAAMISGTPLYDPSDPIAAHNILHPTQLYQAVADFLLFLLLLALVRYKLFAGARALTFIGVYAISRFTVELFRGDIERGVYTIPGTSWAISTSQALCLAGLVFVAIAAPKLARRRVSPVSEASRPEGPRPRAGSRR